MCAVPAGADHGRKQGICVGFHPSPLSWADRPATGRVQRAIMPEARAGTSIFQHLTQYSDLLRYNSNVRWLWFSHVLSLFGDWFNFIASTQLVAQLAPSPLALSILVGIRTASPVFGAPLVPYIVRRMRRRTLLIGADVIRFFSVLALLLIRSPEDLWILYTMIGLQGFLAGMFMPVRMAILPKIVTNEHELGTANTLSSLSWTAMIALGMSLGGVVTAKAGINVSFVVDALTFLGSAGLITLMHYERNTGPDQPRGTGTPATDERVTYPDLFRFLRVNLDFLFVGSMKTVVTVFSFVPTQVLQVMLSYRYEHIGPSAIVVGIIFGIGGLASFFAPLVTRVFIGNDHMKLRHAVTMSFLLTGLGMWLQAPIPPFPVLLFGVALRNVGAVLIWTFSSQILLSRVPAAMRDHVLSAEFLLLNLAGILGVVLPALTSGNPDRGIPIAFFALGMCFAVGAGGWALWLIRGRYSLPEVEPE